MSIAPTPTLLLVDIPNQRLIQTGAGEDARLFTVSTSRNPPSCRADSFGTPWGLHAVVEKHGEGAPAGTVFRGRRSVGSTFGELPADQQAGNLITSRILRLRGLEPGLNAGPERDSYDRYIYIHGTNHEGRLGRPFSGGCIEMANTDIITLFPEIPKGTLVWIDPPAGARS
ncbi:MAG: L,D-transpeptidase [Opitutales bacterium]